jgi:subtilisin family serine protease
MKYTALFVSLLFLAFLSIHDKNVFSREAGAAKAAYAPGSILVKMKSEAEPVADSSRLAEELLPAMGQRSELIGERRGIDGSERGGLYVIELAEGASVEEAIERASADPRVEYAEPDYLLFPAAMPNDTLFNQQWALLNHGESSGKPGADIGATRAWDLTQGSERIVVAVIDTGVDLSHPDLRDNAWVNGRETAGNGADDDGNGFVDDVNGWNFVTNSGRVYDDAQGDFHGTHVAGIIGATGNNGTGVTGVAWRVKIMSLKFIGTREGKTSDAVKAISYVMDQKRRGVNVRVINASWGGPAGTTALRDTLKAAGDAGILFACAAGNGGADRLGDNIDETPDYPSFYSTEISSIVPAAALDRGDNLASFSNYGQRTVFVGAPGVNILSTAPDGRYSFATGTSMAAPHVAGIAALVFAQESSLSAAQVRERIIEGAEPTLALVSKTRSAARAHAFNAASGTTSPAGRPVIAAVKTNKKGVIVDGLGFLNGTAVIEANGVALSKIKYDSSFELANGTLTRLTAKIKKSGLSVSFPQGVPVAVTVFNPSTGERSAAFTYTRP